MGRAVSASRLLHEVGEGIDHRGGEHVPQLGLLEREGDRSNSKADSALSSGSWWRTGGGGQEREEGEELPPTRTAAITLTTSNDSSTASADPRSHG